MFFSEAPATVGLAVTLFLASKLRARLLPSAPVTARDASLNARVSRSPQWLPQKGTLVPD